MVIKNIKEDCQIILQHLEDLIIFVMNFVKDLLIKATQHKSGKRFCLLASLLILLLLFLKPFTSVLATVDHGSADWNITTNTNITEDQINIGNMTISGTAQVTVSGNITIQVNNKLWIKDTAILYTNAINANQTSGGVGVTIEAADLEIESGASINGNGRGYLGRHGCTAVGYGPGAGGLGCASGSHWCGGGGGYGGKGGGGSIGGGTYGSACSPVDLGSGGGAGLGLYGGNGGSAVKLVVENEFTINGAIDMGGENGSWRDGGGAGGSIWVVTDILNGSGSFYANGGYGGYGGGGGGKIAIYYSSESTLVNIPTESVNTAGGTGGHEGGGTGTVVYGLYGDFIVKRFHTQLTTNNEPIGIGATTAETTIRLGAWTDTDNAVDESQVLQLEVRPVGTAFSNSPTHTASAVTHLTTTPVLATADVTLGNGSYHWQARFVDSNGNPIRLWQSFPYSPSNSENTPDFIIDTSYSGTTTNPLYPDLTIDTNWTFNQPSYSKIYYYRNLTTTGTSQLTVAGDITLSITGNLTLQDTSILYTNAINTNQTSGGVGVTIEAADLEIESGASINGNGRGYLGRHGCTAVGYGPGAGGLGCASGSHWCGGGGGYGGKGGGGSIGGGTYGSACSPVDLGSGGGAGLGLYGGNGGSAVKLVVENEFTINGAIDMGGENGSWRDGGGAGGSIWVVTDILNGSGSFYANGGYGGYGGGGGGKIAIYYSSESTLVNIPTESVNTAGGTGGHEGGGTGTVVYGLYGDFIVKRFHTQLTTNNEPIGIGATTAETTIRLGAWTDTDNAVDESQVLQLEVRPVGTAFSNSPTHTASAVTHLTTTPVLATADVTLGNGSYHWQARFVDSNGNPIRLWQSFPYSPSNSENTPDFIIDTSYSGTTTNPLYPDLTIDTNWTFNQPSYSKIYYYRNLTTTGTSQLTVAGDITLSITGNLTLQDTSILYTNAINTNQTSGGVGVTIEAADLEIESGASINGNGRGYLGRHGCTAVGYGPGAGGLGCASGSHWCGGGGGYGGKGGGGSIGGGTYGSACSPIDLGSGGGAGLGLYGGNGGSAVKLVVENEFTINGAIDMGGENGSWRDGGGAGGSIWVVTDILNGSGSFYANGGYGGYGGGGGGKIAIYYSSESTLVNIPTESVNTAGGTGGHEGGGTGTVVYEVSLPNVQFTTTGSSGNESETPANLELILSETGSLDVTVDYSVTGGTAIGSGTDYTLASGSVTIPAGSTTTTIDTVIIDDSIDENNETIEVTLSNSTNANLGGNTTHTYTINDNDSSPTVQFTSTFSNGSESTTPVGMQVSLSTVSGLDVSANFAVTGGTAIGSGIDYTLASGSVTIPAGSTTNTIDTVIIDDLGREMDETIEVTLSNPVNSTLGTNQVYTYTIYDNDTTLPTLQFSSAGSSGAESVSPAGLVLTISPFTGYEVTVDYSVTGGTATGDGEDYTLANGSLTIPADSTTVAINAIITNDTKDEPNETIQVTISNPGNATLGSQTSHTYTILDNDEEPEVQFALNTSTGNEGSGSIELEIVLGEVSGFDITVDYEVTGGTGSGDSTTTTGTVTIPAGSTSAFVPIDVPDDGESDPGETVEVTISSPNHASLGSTTTHTITVEDPPGLSGSMSQDDPGGPMVLSANGDESVTPVLIEIVLSYATTQDVLVNYAVTGGTATGGGVDFTMPDGIATILAGETSTLIQAEIIDDTLDEPDETIEITLSDPTNATLGENIVFIYTINDNDEAAPSEPTVEFSYSSSSNSEETDSVTLEVKLSKEWSTEVTVDFEVTGGTAQGAWIDYYLGNGTLTFKPNDTKETIGISIYDDEVLEQSETIELRVFNPTGATLGSNKTYTYTILDNDEPTPSPSAIASPLSSPLATASPIAEIMLQEPEGWEEGKEPGNYEVIIRIIDQNGNPIKGVTITFVNSEAGGKAAVFCEGGLKLHGLTSVEPIRSFAGAEVRRSGNSLSICGLTSLVFREGGIKPSLVKKLLAVLENTFIKEVRAAILSQETDENGITVFKDIPKGEYNLKIAYKNFASEKTIEVEGDKRIHEFIITLKMEEGQSFIAQKLSGLFIPSSLLAQSEKITPTATGLTSVAVAASLATALGVGLLELPLLLRQLASYLLGLLGWKRKKKPWGVTYNAQTKQPLPRVIVRLYTKGNNLVSTEVTGNSGIFSFIPKQGSYTLRVSKPGFIFPSKTVTTGNDGPYTNVYRKERFNITSAKTPINFSIPLDPITPKKGVELLARAARFIRNFFQFISWPMVVFGTASSTYAAAVNTTPTNTLIFFFNLFLFASKVWAKARIPRYWGQVINLTTGKPMGGLELALINQDYQKTTAVRVSNKDGNYQFIAPPGRYVIKIGSLEYRLAKTYKKGFYNRGTINIKHKTELINPKIAVVSKV